MREVHSSDLSVDEFYAYFYVTHPDADKQVYDTLFTRLRETEMTPDVGLDIVNQFVLRKNALKLSEVAFEVSQGKKSVEELKSFTESLDTRTPVQTLPLNETTSNLEELVTNLQRENGFRWRLNCLNKSLGSIRRGDFGFIFARPETGKTTFLASEITNFIQNPTGLVCWLNKEEDGWKVMLRVYCAYFGVSSDVILSNVKKFSGEFREQVGDRFKLFDSATIGKRDVENIISKLSPSVVVYDQIDKIKGFANDREDLRLGSIYQWARELAKGNHAAIGVCQADGHAEGVRYLTMEHVANAKTAKQAEADFILGIGKDGNPDLASARFLTISKNKLLGDPDSIPDLRHGRFEVLIEPTIARYVDVINYD